ncbi:molybdopterin dinucleotide binding domain-containing protein [Parazoarcus communis]|uniref:Tetrathionate reductase subunit TtrA n=1 Tax=Parazoarcus communis SWub3 = DSM 12120 TaxID=1121029 RepID=A0A323UW23_9RHOO|nr:molybdopterin dinucleotide binding domain-containing protein [Parazoarcus communis]NMG72592.1 tetrathionate reductase subunit TtrA [Parazoarcus communis SWub3 = DSM 12120]PZA16431.1 tetrathionate reductase subunit TtrA [Azoarcus communis] [Parazoarcus communis SWub3 = DSM 12120]
MKIERREILAAGGLAAFAAGFSQTLGRMVDGFVAAEEPRIAEGRHIHGRSAAPEYTVDPVSGEFTPNPNQQVSYTACLGCTTLCGVRVRVDKTTGNIIRVGGNPYSPLSTDPHLPMKTSVKESLIAMSRFQDKGLAGRSTACGRGNAAMDQMNSPFRVLTPLKRVGPRNGGQWQPIPFEQLVKELVEGGDLFGEGHVDGLAALRDLNTPIDAQAPELGPRVNQVAVLSSVNDGREAFSRRFWNKAYGTLNHVGHGSYCGGAYRSGSGALFGDLKGMPHAKPDLENAEFVLFIGTAPGNAGNPFKITGAKLAKGRATGTLDYVVVDPVLNNSHNLASAEHGRWVPIRPGTDGALVMGMMRWMFEHDRVNTAYLAYPNQKAAEAGGEPSHTNASWLVIAQEGHPRQGRFLRGSDVGMAIADADRYKDADPYLVIGPDGQPVSAESVTEAVALQANGLQVLIADKAVLLKTAFELLRDSALAYELPEYSDVCGIPVEVISGLADEFTRHGRKASAVAHGGMMAGNGFYNAYAVVTLNALIGNLNWKGGFVINGGGFRDAGAGPRYDLDGFPGQIKPSGTPLGRNVPYERSAEFARRKAEGKPYPARDAWFPNAPGLGTEWFTGALRGYPYGLKALILWSCNPLYGITGIRPLIEKELADPKKLPLIVSVDPLINESNAFADYIVPDSLMYESWGWAAPWNGVPTKAGTARWPVVEPKAQKAADGQPVGMETFYIALAKAMNLPGFGPEGLADMDGKRLPLERPEDWYLRGGANIAFAGKAPVGDASDEDLTLSGVDRLRPALEATLKPDEWRKVAFVLTRGGRYQPVGEAQDADHPEWQTHRFSKPLWLWNDTVGTSRNTLTGKRFAGCAGWQPPAFFDGTPMRKVYTEDEWPLQLVSYKSALQNSYSIATRITGLHPDNPVVVHPADAAGLGLRTGDEARIQTPGGTARCTVIVHEGVTRGVMAVEHGYGHRELGARAHRIGGQSQPDRPDLRAGINLNDLGLADPTRGGEAVWVDAVSGTSVRQGLPARLLRA